MTVTLSIIDILHCYLSYDSLLYSTIAGYSSIAIFSTISSEEGMDVMEDHDQEGISKNGLFSFLNFI